MSSIFVIDPKYPAYQSAYYNRDRMWKNAGSDSAANRRTLVSPSHMLVNIGGRGHGYELTFGGKSRSQYCG